MADLWTNVRDVFLSHSNADKPAIEDLARRLKREGIEPWLDKWNLVPGEPWQKPIEEALARCATCAVFIGPGGFGTWQNEEMRTAIDRRVNEGRFRVIPVLLPGAERPKRSSLPPFLVSTTWVEFRRSLDDEEAFHRLVCGIRGIEPGLGPGVAIVEGCCPYRGLEAFGAEHALFFFGREALTEWLLEALRPAPSGPEGRFLAIVGPSGSGKSSLALAGFVPALKRGGLAGSAEWPVVICRPGYDPLESLAVQLSGLGGGRPNPTEVRQLIAEIGTDSRALYRFARIALRDAPPARRMIVLMDQFEEVFTLCREDSARKALFDNLLDAASIAGGQTMVVLTMRADFYGKCAAYPNLADALSDHQVLVGPLSEDELRRAIGRPAQLVGCEFEPGLVELLIHDLKDQTGALPLLQYALMELWNAHEGRRLTHAAYEKIGGLHGALENRANEVLNGFTDPERELCRRIFLRLTQPGEGTEDTKRRASLRELAQSQDGAESLDAVLLRLVNARLITAEGDEQHSGEGYIEVAHEALVQCWSVLRQWIDADRAGLLTHRRLTEAVREWENNKGDPSYLFEGTRLAVANEWAEAHRDDLNPLELEFLAASLARQRQRKADELEAARRLAAEAEARRRAEEERALEAEQREREAKAKVMQERKARRLTAALAVLGMMLLAGGGWLALERERERGRTEAQVKRALGQMDSHFKEADKAPVDEPEQRKEVADRWRSVLYFAKQAEGALETGTPSSSLRKRTEDILGVIRKKAAAADRDRTMLELLEDARYATSRISNADINYTLARPYIYGSAGAERYAKAFRDYGIDVTALDSADAAALVRARRIRRNLVAALDDWYQADPASRSSRLLAVADDADDDAVRKRIRAAIGRKDRSELLRIADGPEADSFSPQTALLLASGLETPRDTNDSARVARRALSRHPDDFWLNDLAGLYFTYSDPPRPVEALAAYQAALAARPDSNMVLVNIGATWSLLGDYDQAAAVFFQALERDKHYLMIRDGLFQALLNSGNLAGAEAAARAWVRDEPGSPQALGSLASLLHLAGQVEEADRLMKDAIRHRSPDGSDAVFISQKLTLMGRDEDALPYLRQAAKLAAHNGEFASWLGLALLKTSRREEAMVELRRGVELAPRSAVCWRALADGLASEGKFEEALAVDRKALDRDPFQSYVRTAYAYHLETIRKRSGCSCGQMVCSA